MICVCCAQYEAPKDWCEKCLGHLLLWCFQQVARGRSDFAGDYRCHITSAVTKARFVAQIAAETESIRKAKGCDIRPESSRVCERGSKCCVTRHEGDKVKGTL